MIGRRRLVGLSLALAAVVAAPAIGQPVQPADMTIGDPSAKVTVIEYGSASCPHCARFNNDVFPAFKAKYVDTGKVRYVFREFLTQPVELAAAGFLLARCGGPDKYFSILDGVFHAQDEIYQTQDASGPLMRVAHKNGLTDAQAAACLQDKTAIDALNARVRAYETTDKIDSTPTFDVNGRRLQGEQTLAQLGAAVDQASAASTPHAHATHRAHVTHVTHHRRAH
jgi:protein-disulfide isomerase